jgi:hypothetical protein
MPDTVSQTTLYNLFGPKYLPTAAANIALQDSLLNSPFDPTRTHDAHMSSDDSDGGSSFGDRAYWSESDEEAFQETIIYEVESCRKILEEADRRRLTRKQIMELEKRTEVCLECALERSRVALA